MALIPIRKHARRRRLRESAVSREKSISFKRYGGYPFGRVGRKKAVIKGGPTEAEIIEIIRERNYLPGVMKESAADTLDDLLDFNVVPPTVVRITEKGEVVSVQEFVPRATTWNNVDDKLRVNRNDLMKIAILDIILHQGDRHGGNLLVTPDNHAHAIDNENIFAVEVTSIAFMQMNRERIPASIIRKLKNLQKEDFVAALAGATMEQIETAWERKLALEREQTLKYY